MSQLVSLQSQLSAITSDPWTCIMHPVTKYVCMYVCTVNTTIFLYYSYTISNEFCFIREVITRDKIIGKYGLPPEVIQTIFTSMFYSFIYILLYALRCYVTILLWLVTLQIIFLGLKVSSTKYIMYLSLC
jgi:hypothetical protein